MRPRIAAPDTPGHPRMTPRFRLFRRASVAVVVGALVTLFIAWPLSLAFDHFGVVGPLRAGPRYTEEEVELDGVAGHVPILCKRLRGLLSEEVRLTVFGVAPGFRWLPLPARPPPEWATSPIDQRRLLASEITTWAHGWPFRSLASERWDSRGAAVDRHVLVLRPIARNLIRVPLRPIWPGLIINTIFWATAWWVVWAGTPKFIQIVRGQMRRRRTLCPHCAYDLRATPPTSPCPECGQTSAR